MALEGIDALGLNSFGGGGLASMFGPVGGLPQPMTNGVGYTPNRNNAPVYSSAGLTNQLVQPWDNTPGNRSQPYSVNPGSVDPGLWTTLNAASAGSIDRGANAFLGGGFNPWTQESGGPEGMGQAPANQAQQIGDLFSTAQRLGIDTSQYSQNPGTNNLWGERSGERDAMQLYDDLNQHTKDYVSVGGLSNGWSGGGNAMGNRTIYREQDGQLLPVSRPRAFMNNPDNGFFSRDFRDMMMTVGLPALGGVFAAPAAAGSGGASMAGSAANAVGLGSQWASLPAWAQQAATGAAQGALTSGLQGGNPLQGALTGGVTGGAGGAATGLIGSMGLPAWANQAMSGAFRGGLGAMMGGGNAIGGALQGGLGGLGGAYGRSIDPRLMGVGNMAGRTLASLFTSRGQ